MASKIIRLRKYPFPYRALLSISSDLDGTSSFEDYVELIRYLNTDSQTNLGPGLGLEFSNSLYFSMPKRQFSYWNSCEGDREKTRALMRSGFIDTLHSFGNGVSEKRSLDAALNEIVKHNMRFPIWVNHSTAPTNLSSARRPGIYHGDDEDHALYHINKLLALGLVYVCRGQATSIIGQEVIPSPSTVLYRKKLLQSATTAMVQAGKLVASPLVSRYRMHLRNQVLAPTVLTDSSEVLEFMRANWYWGGVGAGASLGSLGEILRESALTKLVRRQGASVLYTHLGRLPAVRNKAEGLSAISGLCTLANFAHDYLILVKSTSWMLDYLSLCSNLSYSVGQDGDIVLEIREQTPRKMENRLNSFLPTSGLTFYFEGEPPPSISFCGRRLPKITLNPPDQTGFGSASLPLCILQLPDDI